MTAEQNQNDGHAGGPDSYKYNARVDYYAEFGVSPDDFFDEDGQPLGVAASEDKIKSIYRKQARNFHPDVNKNFGARKRFEEIAEAFAVLTDPKIRAQYNAVRGIKFDPKRREANRQSAPPGNRTGEQKRRDEQQQEREREAGEKERQSAWRGQAGPGWFSGSSDSIAGDILANVKQSWQNLQTPPRTYEKTAAPDTTTTSLSSPERLPDRDVARLSNEIIESILKQPNVIGMMERALEAQAQHTAHVLEITFIDATGVKIDLNELAKVFTSIVAETRTWKRETLPHQRISGNLREWINMLPRNVQPRVRSEIESWDNAQPPRIVEAEFKFSLKSIFTGGRKTAEPVRVQTQEQYDQTQLEKRLKDLRVMTKYTASDIRRLFDEKFLAQFNLPLNPSENSQTPSQQSPSAPPGQLTP